MFKAVICGAGTRGLEHIQAVKLTAGVELKGVFDLSASARQAAEGLTAAPSYNQFKPLLVEHQPDLVIIATPPHVRLNLVEQIVQCDSVRMVVVEKPLALTLAEGRRIVSLCQEHGLALVVGHQLRFSPEFIQLKAALSAGAVGQLRSLQAYCYGNLFNQGSHLIDLFYWLLEGSPAEWVTAQGCDDLAMLGRLTQISPDFTVDTSHPAPLWLTANIAFSGGIQASLSSGLLTPITQPELGP
jgi:predicted dehydrogenase